MARSRSTFSVRAPQRSAERTAGLDPAVRARTEARAGVPLGDVRVHYNSPAPRVLGAGAYAFGDEIHLGPGQEEHLAHEAWHVAQQRRGDVAPTGRSEDGRPLNDDPRLEHDAGAMAHAAPAARADAAPAATANAAAAVFPAVLQLAFKARQTTKGTWILTGRPEFRGFVRKAVIKKYNADWEHDDELPYDVSLSDEELDQCHVIAWATIRDGILEAYLNEELTQSQFEQKTDALYGEEADTDEYDEMVAARQEVTDAGPDDADPDDVVLLGKLLNSATPNLRLDDKTANRKIKDRPDPHLVLTPKRKHYEMSPNSELNLTENRDISRSPLWTPNRTHIYSSSTGPLSPKRLKKETLKLWK
ncbi:MAG TPA: DUF4157 domain-containing protein [Candidatus Limnocylindrales bacterium]|nr:DUF4157 domain-containing protein [Candidatus Limnocylindrales bacterium]